MILLRLEKERNNFFLNRGVTVNLILTVMFIFVVKFKKKVDILGVSGFLGVYYSKWQK